MLPPLLIALYLIALALLPWTARFRGWNHAFDILPFSVGHISWVELVAHPLRVSEPTEPFKTGSKLLAMKYRARLLTRDLLTHQISPSPFLTAIDGHEQVFDSDLVNDLQVIDQVLK
jgi:hypothetical protein